MEKFFAVNVDKYVEGLDFNVYRPSSLHNPKSNAVSFLTVKNYDKYKVFEKVKDCLIFWPQSIDIPLSLYERGHAILKCADPHLRFCEFFEENEISNTPKIENVRVVNGAFIADGAMVDSSTIIQPGAYISGNTKIGKNSYIGCGVKIIGKVVVGENVEIRENTVIGADGLTTDRNDKGNIVKMPQFGGVIVNDRVTIGANCVIARGAIDNTIIGKNSSIDNCVFISHNVQIGERVLVVGESIIFGSVVIEDDVYISGNATIRNGIRVGNKSVIGMGAVVTKNVANEMIVKGNPAR